MSNKENIENNKEEGIKFHVNVDFARGQVQTNYDNTATLGFVQYTYLFINTILKFEKIETREN